MSIDLPDAISEVPLTMSDGAVIKLRRHGNPDGPRLAFSHGNGLAIDVYACFWSHFCNSYDVVIFDMRNHGCNPRHTLEAHTWEQCTSDMSAVRRGISTAFGKKPITGIFHSLSAVSALRAALGGDPCWERLILFDPPMCPTADTGMREEMDEHVDLMVRRSARRPESYASPREFGEQLKANARFATWPEGTHELFALATRRENKTNGRWDLSCPREFEARIFDTNRHDSAFRYLLETPGLPVTLIAADPSFDDDMPAKVCAYLASHTRIDYEFVPGTTHLLQLERPDACAAAVEWRLSQVTEAAGSGEVGG